MVTTETVAATKQIPIVCPGHTRPLAELQFCQTGTFVVWVDVLIRRTRYTSNNNVVSPPRG
jgi:hypothetical protein